MTHEEERLDYLRQELKAERISYDELAELRDLADFIDGDDAELLEAAGVPEAIYNDTAIDEILEAMTREQIIKYIDGYGDPVDWTDYSAREILQEVAQSDANSGEPHTGILASMYGENL